MKSIAIIGGGITGLVTAFKLKSFNIPTTIYEASDRAGGVIKSLKQNGFLAEFGPNTILETSYKITDLIREAGLENNMLYSDPKAEKRYIVRFQKPIELSPSPLKFFMTPLFSLSTKLCLLKEPFIPKWNNQFEENVAQFVLRRLNQEFLDYGINPLVAGIYAGAPDRLSVKHAFPKLYEVEQKYGSLIKGQIFGAKERRRRGEISKQEAKKISFDEGLEVLTQKLFSQLFGSIRLNTKVIEISKKDNEWAVTSRSFGREVKQMHSAVLLAIPTYAMSDIKIDLGSTVDIHELTQIKYPPVTTIVLGYKRTDVPHPLDGFGMLIPEKEGFHILGTLFSSSLFPNRAPAGFVTLTSYIGGMRNPDLALKDPEELINLTHTDLTKILGISNKPVFQNCFCYKNAIPQYEVGYGKFKDLMTEAESKSPGLFFAGHYRNGISISDSILSGLNVAEKIRDWLNTKKTIDHPQNG
jgi:oxygen-dependent protoporphyrinogen oxidase